MITIAIANQKGGVAKTTTAKETAAMLARDGARVLALDLDGQYDLTTFFLDGVPEFDLADVLEGRAEPFEAIYETQREGVFVLGASDSAYRLEGLGTRAISKTLEGVGDHFDYCIIDFPRALSELTISAFLATDYLVITTDADRASVNGIAKLLEVLETVEGTGRKVEVAGVLFTRHNARTTIAREYEAIARELAEERGIRVFESCIPLSAAVVEANGYGLALEEHKPGSKPAKAYRAYLGELLENIK